jgi:hypothetical protein
VRVRLFLHVCIWERRILSSLLHLATLDPIPPLSSTPPARPLAYSLVHVTPYLATPTLPLPFPRPPSCSGNQIGDSGAVALVGALAGLTALEKLGIS